MTLLRSTARTMLASYFVAADSRPSVIPSPWSPRPSRWSMVSYHGQGVRAGAGRRLRSGRHGHVGTHQRLAQLVGGAALATGKGRRLGALLLAGSLVPTTIGKYPFWSRRDPEERAQDRDHFLKNVSLLGGVLIASRDTEGKPSLA